MADPISIRHLRAQAACNAVASWSNGNSLKKHAQGLPVLIRSMGLGAAVALLYKGETAALSDDLARWMLEQHPGRPLGKKGGGVPAFLSAWTNLPARQAMSLEEEGLRFAESLKLFAGGLYGP